MDLQKAAPWLVIGGVAAMIVYQNWKEKKAAEAARVAAASNLIDQAKDAFAPYINGLFGNEEGLF